MVKRKITKNDVDTAYEMAAKAKESALFSLRRAKQLKDGADKIKAEYKRSQKEQRKGR